MNQSLRGQINDLADKVREAFNITTPIYDIEEVVRIFGGNILMENNLENFADAKIEKSDNSFIITVSNNQSAERKKFSIAHELGHLFLHMGYCIDKDMWESNENNRYFRNLSGEMEYQAHEFAAAFLMPKNEFVKVMQQNLKLIDNEYIYDMDAVADYFKVSVPAAINRGKWLNMISWNN
ncbi:ImmA/IrrE family metallo-endopeptidase [Clostridium beijerinckii]|uniref:ImmA/IrrE family metallo-endopeptidase n=1 Tax=Clostridium beijerinckii TaxID=1520 RepID=UPI00098C3893|nr:ImmA/IrrE family metallo-endopeptidase [Clostridium beijerinckii]MBA8937210.1 Zn-dependent peptidase ImmA (M78 family) [Clostridium beijerinckii]NRU40324.1 Zn-dependent peptidase ImmA (M78 family) [Clostridium beijerinckii]NSA96399.1 Zn-dependent peptidase ImmA (M78 family) [Clostridium beijerinckii]OOM66038.1 hypothetical protein CLOBI_08780 [Clostridium beijerinckii]OOM72073.1 hypothetical protein CLBEIC_08180 [Clostridium beijerinckii]